MKRFQILNGAGAGEIFDVGEKRVVIGRGQDQDIILADDRSSRSHVALEVRGDTAFVIDLGSSNGTFVNGELVMGELELREGDVLLVGSTEIQYGEASPWSRVQSKGREKTLTEAERKSDTVLSTPGELAASRSKVAKRAEAERVSSLPTVVQDGVPEIRASAKTTLPSQSPEAKASAAPPIMRSSVGALPEDLSGLAKALVEFAGPLAQAKGVTLQLEADAPVAAVPMDARRAYVALAGAIELAVVIVNEGRACVLRALCEEGRRASLGFVVSGGMAPAERDTTRMVAGRFGEARAAAESTGGGLELTPDDDPEVLWRFWVPL